MLSAALLVARRQAHSKSHRKSNMHSGNQHDHVELQELLLKHQPLKVQPLTLGPLMPQPLMLQPLKVQPLRLQPLKVAASAHTHKHSHTHTHAITQQSLAASIIWRAELPGSRSKDPLSLHCGIVMLCFSTTWAAVAPKYYALIRFGGTIAPTCYVLL